jgi:hypothetical protein
VQAINNIIPFRERTLDSDRINKVLTLFLVTGLLTFVSPAAPAQAASIGNDFCASDSGSSSGVVVASSHGYCYVAFTNTGTNTWTAPSGVTFADFLIIAGGGAGGGGAWGGGAGAGEVVHYTNYSVSSSSALNLNVGSGGTPGTASLDPALNRSNPGSNSWVGSSSGVVAQGGGAGASYAYNSASTYSTGQNGGSGGAGTENIASSSPSINNLGGTSTKTTSGSRTGYGNNGGRGGPSASTQSGGGGGGAGGVGADAGTAVGGNGGTGTNLFSTWLSAINSGMSGITGWQTATSTGYIAGGGGGGTTTTRGAAGSGGAGRGGSNSDFYNGESAIANTGSGGGGSGYGGSSKIGGTGGSGLIIIRYSSFNSTNDSAISLNGSSQYAAASGAQVIPTSTSSTFSVEAWIRQPASRSSESFYQILSQGTSGNIFYVKVVNGSVRFGRSGYTGGENICIASVPTDEWTHIALVVGPTSQSCYINGSPSGSFSQSGATAIGTTFAMGQFAPTGGEYFLGQIDEVKIWNTSRTQGQIQSDLKTYGGSLADGLVAYYNFNEAFENKVLNRSTGGSSTLDLTTVNSPTITSTSIVETSTVNAYTVVKFMRSFLVAQGGWTSPANRQLRALAVGGGGGGNRGVCGVNYGAGGGGGQAREQIFASASSAVFSVIVGPGGAKATGNCNVTPNTSGTNGGDSTFGTTTSVGGTAALYNSRVGGSSGSNTGGTGTGTYGAGGGGGGGGVGVGNNGGAGYLFSITGLTYGGGGAGRDSAVFGTASGGGSNGSADAVANRGGGGADWTSGGSGVVIVAYITNTPTIITQPLSDTTTAGIVETFTINTSAAPTPLTKSVQWQFTADTTTGTTGWTNVSLGTGITTDTFTTVALTTSMNKYRYRAIITFSDTSTIAITETTTAVILTINPAITITSETSTITRKYGDTQTVLPIRYTGGTTSTGAVGTTDSHTVRGAYGTLASGKIVLDTSTSTVVFKVDTGTVVGTYVETITVTDFKGATATYTQRVVVTQADTLTVQADTRTAITYGGSISPAYTASGLVNGDSIASISYGHVSCANGGKCAVGDIGPGGGVVFYVSQSTTDSQTAISGYTSGGIYLEAAPVGWGNGIAVAAGETTGTSYLDPVVNWCNTAFDFNSKGAGIGLGGDNSKKIDTNCSSGAGQLAVDLVLKGKNDWYLPSQDELTQMGVQKNLIGLLYGVNNCYGSTCYWSSTQNGGGSSVRGLQVTSSSETMGNNDTLLTASNKVMVRPIRAFSPITNNSETVTAGAPTAAGTYLLRPTAITLANGVSTDNYVSVVFRSSQSTISRAPQTPKISMQPAKAIYDTGTATQALTATSSSVATGAVFYLIAAGGDASCSISGSTLSITSAGVCNVTAFKQASTNYLYDSATAVAVTFTRFISSQPVQVQLYPTMIPLNGANAIETTTVTSSTLTISSVTKTGAGAYTIGGTGFSNIEVIRIGGTNLSGSNYTVGGVNSITLSGVSAFTGPLFIRKTDGQEVVYFQFDWS